MQIDQAHGDLPINGIAFSSYHVVSAGDDKLACVFHTAGTDTSVVTKMRHTGKVLCVEVLSLRVVTGASDGRVRM